MPAMLPRELMARQRMALLEECYDPVSHHRLAGLGIQPGWRCLEIGAGSGSVAGWIADQVGSEGHVLATDLLAERVETGGRSNVEVRRHDVTCDALPEAAFDLIHARLVLMVLPQREAVLPRLISALKPGGWLLTEDHDCHTTRPLSSSQCSQAGEVMVERVRRAGLDPLWATGAALRMAEHGLVEVAAETDMRVFQGGSLMAQLWRLTWTQLPGRHGNGGADGFDEELMLTMLGDPAHRFAGPTSVATRGRRPPVTSPASR